MTVKVKQLRPGSWYLVVRWQGKKFVKRVADTRRDAQEIANELTRELQFRGYGALEAFKPKGRVQGLTVEKYADRWIEELKQSGLKPATVASYESNLRIHIKPFFGELPLGSVSYSHVKEFIADRLQETYRRADDREGIETPRHPYSRDAIRLMVATLRAMLEEAVREELIESNPVHGLGRFYSAAKRLRENPDPFGLPELHSVEGLAGEWLPFILFQTRTGARVGEAIALQWPDIDWAREKAWIRRTMPINRQVGSPKTSSSNRWVDLSPELVSALKRHEAAQRTHWFSKGLELPEWVFATAGGEAPDYSNFRRAFRRIQRKAGVRERRPHDLRHTYASLQLAAGKPINYVSAQLGHKSAQITLTIYSRWVPGTDPGGKDTLDATTKRQRTATGDDDGL